MPSSWTTFWAGVRDTSPLILGVSPFGLIFGAVCATSGMPEWGAIGFSAIIFAGASQLVATQLMAEHASMAVVVLTGLIINMRYLMYSASIAPHLKSAAPLKKPFLAYILTDQAYAVCITHFSRSTTRPHGKLPYYLGSALTMWTCFNVTTAIGAYLGAVIPPEWDLGFAIPVTFIAVVVPAIKDRPALMAALAAGGVAWFADPLPCNLGLMAAALCGILVGYVTERSVSHD